MKDIQVFYFSRTGNSARVAKKISEKLNGELIEVTDRINWKGFFGFIKGGFYATIDKKVKIHLSSPINPESIHIAVSPLWASGSAPAIRSLLREIPLNSVYLVITSIGSTIKKRDPYRAVYDVVKENSNEDTVIDQLVSELKSQNS